MKKRKVSQKVELYYIFQDDIACVVAGDKLFKYIGRTGTDRQRLLSLEYPIEKWYEAETPPWASLGWQKLGEL